MGADHAGSSDVPDSAYVGAVATYGTSRRELPDIPLRFWPIIAGAGIAQIGGPLEYEHMFDILFTCSRPSLQS